MTSYFMRREDQFLFHMDYTSNVQKISYTAPPLLHGADARDKDLSGARKWRSDSFYQDTENFVVSDDEASSQKEGRIWNEFYNYVFVFIHLLLCLKKIQFKRNICLLVMVNQDFAYSTSHKSMSLFFVTVNSIEMFLMLVNQYFAKLMQIHCSI